MNKKMLVVAGMVLLAAGCSKAQPSAQTPTTQTTTQATASTQGSASFKDMLAMGKSQKCDAQFTSGQTTSEGTIYLANGQMRGDFTAQDNGKTIQSHMIVKDQTVYSWMEGMGMNMAFKSALSANSQSSNNQQSSMSTDVNQKVNYNCQSWTEDDSMFALPTGITFSDSSSMMAPPAAASASIGASASASECAACNSVPAAAKAQCLAALKCN